MENDIPFNKAEVSENDRLYVSEAISKGHISGNGPFTKRAEQLLEQSLGIHKALLVTSCTHALEICGLLLDLKSGDEVIVPSFTFVSSASAFMSRGAKPIFVDVDPRTLNIDPKCVEQAITARTRAICVVHYAGVPVDLDEIMRLCKKYNLFLVEDNAHGLFSKYKGRSLGTFGDLATLSFHETKNITCGEGGALLINSAQFVDRAEILREKGTDRTKFLRGQVDKYTWVDIGSSWVMSDILAAILASQLERASEIQKKRELIYNFYQSHLEKWSVQNDIQIPFVPDDCEHSSHMYYLRLPDGESRDRFIGHLKSRGVNAVFHYQPLHLSAVGKSLGGFVGQCPISEEAGDCLVRLPLFTQLTPEMLSQIIDAVISFSI